MSSSSKGDSRPAIHTPGSRRAALIAIVVLGVLALFLYLSPLSALLKDETWVKTLLASTGAGAPFLFTIGTAFLVALGMPRLVLCFLAGSLFGWLWAITLTQIGTVLGAYLTFLFVRHFGGALSLQQNNTLQSWTEPLRKQGLISVLLLRQLPINGLTNDLFLGLSPVSHGNFLTGTFIGFLPQGLAACLMGAGLIQNSIENLSYYVIAALAFWIIAHAIKQRIQAMKQSNLLGI